MRIKMLKRSLVHSLITHIVAENNISFLIITDALHSINCCISNCGTGPNWLPRNWRFKPYRAQFVSTNRFIGQFLHWFMGPFHVFRHYTSVQIIRKFPIQTKGSFITTYHCFGQHSGNNVINHLKPQNKYLFV